MCGWEGGDVEGGDMDLWGEICMLVGRLAPLTLIPWNDGTKVGQTDCLIWSVGRVSTAQINLPTGEEDHRPLDHGFSIFQSTNSEFSPSLSFFVNWDNVEFTIIDMEIHYCYVNLIVEKCVCK